MKRFVVLIVILNLVLTIWGHPIPGVPSEGTEGTHEGPRPKRQLFREYIPRHRPLTGNTYHLHAGFPHPGRWTEGAPRVVHPNPAYPPRHPEISEYAPEHPRNGGHYHPLELQKLQEEHRKHVEAKKQQHQGRPYGNQGPYGGHQYHEGPPPPEPPVLHQHQPPPYQPYKTTEPVYHKGPPPKGPPPFNHGPVYHVDPLKKWFFMPKGFRIWHSGSSGFPVSWMNRY